MNEQAAKKEAKGNICHKKRHHGRRNSKGAHREREMGRGRRRGKEEEESRRRERWRERNHVKTILCPDSKHPTKKPITSSLPTLNTSSSMRFF